MESPVLFRFTAKKSRLIPTLTFWIGLVVSGSVFGAGYYNVFFLGNSQEKLVQSGLVLAVDSIRADGGTAAYSQGCAAGDLTWNDLSSSSSDGTLTGFSSCGSSSGWVGLGTTASPIALALDGSSNYVSIPKVAASTITEAQPISILFWFYPNSAIDSVIVGDAPEIWPWSGHWVQWSHFSSQTFSWAIDDTTGTPGAAQITSVATLSLSHWHHVAVTYDGSKQASGMKIYFDGAETSATTNSDILVLTSDTSQPWAIGADPTGSGDFFDGQIAAVQIYNQALTADEVKTNCKAQVHRFSDGTCS
jgi:hypothetical protein